MRKLSVEPTACFLVAVILLTLPLNWLIAMAAAALFHELCHIFAVFLAGGQIRSIRIQPDGAVIETAPLSPLKELVCILSGPAGSLMLLFFCRAIPRISLCAGIQGLYNLLPLYPLDGGRALICVLEMAFPIETVRRIVPWIQRSISVSILVLALYAAFAWNWGWMPVFMSFMLLLKKNTLQTEATRGTIVLPYKMR